MFIHFYLHFSTRFGQDIFVSGNNSILGNDNTACAIPLQYVNNNLWHGTIELDPKQLFTPLRYKYFIRYQGKIEWIDAEKEREVNIPKISTQNLILIDTWNSEAETGNIFFTRAFQNVLVKSPKSVKKSTENKTNYTHEFKIKVPLLKENEKPCILGSGKVLNNWKADMPLLLAQNGSWWSGKIDFSGEDFPIAYKYGIYDSKNKQLLELEGGDNRQLPLAVDDSTLILHDGLIRISHAKWKGAGVAIPVFSLRSKKSWGTGEFPDIKLLVDWAKQTGIQLVQLLPVNDTTLTYTQKDSYPYAAISAFALHPLYLNIDRVARKEDRAVVQSALKLKKALNDLADMDYEQAMAVKMQVIRQLFHAQKNQFKNDEKYAAFFIQNKHWLVPYAVFSYLKNKYGTADFTKWKTHAVYDETAVNRLARSAGKHYDAIVLHYFIQYHLHLQLADAVNYAHKKGIVIKGDIPIGIHKNSVDVWMNPDLYNVSEQAGAPPDAFAVKGQNWGFPTYRWQKMQENNFDWWQMRLKNMSHYFDAFRIDHILGFFRIWSIPNTQVEGVMGRFVPAIPMTVNDFLQKNISFNRQRYTQPFITSDILNNLFRNKLEEVKNIFFNGDEFKKEFNTQQKIESYFAGTTTFDHEIKQKLFDLVSNIILLEEENSNGQSFHFRINMEQTSSFQYLPINDQQKLKKLYTDYFYHRQEDVWRKEAMTKLAFIKSHTDMLVCGENLGMVPHSVPEVMQQLGILSLEIQRMPKDPYIHYSHPANAPYLSVVSPSTHDMSTIREWWEENKTATQYFYNNLLECQGEAPAQCQQWISKTILLQHLYSPAMWSIFQLQDILGMSDFRRENPQEERINIPADPDHYWKYRMHIQLEDLIKATDFNTELHNCIKASGR